MTLADLAALVPILCVTAAGIACMLAEALRAPGERLPISGLGQVGLVGAGITAVLLWGRNTSSFGMVLADNFGLFVVLVLVVIGILTLLFSPPLVDRDGLPGGEYYALILFGLAGMMLMAMATDLLLIFLALEVLSLAVYVLTAIRRDAFGGAEAAFKYFMLGAFSSAFFLYGIAFAFGLSGSTGLDRLGSVVAADAMNQSPLALLALGLLLVGFAFKVSAVPFHMWTPDAYEGAPTIVAGFMSTSVKAAAFAAFTRVFLSALEPLRPDWAPALWAIAAATMVLGTVVGVAQTNLKRMLAYSSIAHAGYLLVALVSANDVGKSAVLFYLLVYGVTNLGAFAAIALLGTRDHPNDDLASYAGLSTRHPALAATLAVFLLSLGGLPPTAGFVGKWYVFSAAVQAGYYGLAVIGVLTSVVSIFFYLRVIVMMYMAAPTNVPAPAAPSRAAVFALAASVLATFYLGVLPGRLIDLASRSIATIF
ncbi:MAG TPA: NADH-quinone oxidoreductase subunit N [Vicinamibacterales bacterium]|nr:NADH-quinone oxidoreductase subunit N [Vicinamibacterales bacterium]